MGQEGHTKRSEKPYTIQNLNDSVGISQELREIFPTTHVLMAYCKGESDRDIHKFNTFSFSLTFFSLFLYSMTTFRWKYMIKGRRKPQYSIDEVKKVMKVMEKTLTIYQFMYLDKFL